MSAPVTYHLVIRADRTVRVARKPRLAADEVAVAIKVTFPPGWGTVIGSIAVTAPELPPTVEYEEVSP